MVSRVMGVLALLSFPCFAVQLADIPQLVREGNTEVRSSEKDVEAAGHAIWTARSRAYPTLNVFNSYVHVGSDIQLQLPPKTFDIGASTLTVQLPPVTFQAQDVFFSALMLKAPLFTGGRITAGVSAAQAKRDEAKAEHAKVSDEKTQEAINRYLSVQLARKAVTTLNAIAQDLTRIRQIAESLVKTGLGTKFAVMQIRVAQADLESRRAEASGKSEVADLAFKVSVGKSPLEDVVYETPLHKAGLPPKADPFKTVALNRRSEFKILEAKAGQVDALRSATFGKMLPLLYAVGSYQLYNKNLPLLQPNWTVGVVLDIPLTGFLEALPERAEAIRLQEKVAIQGERAKEEIPLLIDKLYAELRSAHASHAAIRESAELSKEGLRLAEVRFKSGNGSVLEVLKASADYEAGQIKLAQLTHEYDLKLLELYSAAADLDGFIRQYADTKAGDTP